jgi:hypothetical protein
VCDWITEKSEKLENDDLAKDLTTVKALQRKHKGIERELAPIKDKVRKRYLGSLGFMGLEKQISDQWYILRDFMS